MGSFGNFSYRWSDVRIQMSEIRRQLLAVSRWLLAHHSDFKERAALLYHAGDLAHRGSL
jgi:aminoglycoside phosphotransferase (APT) family kinase protein